MIKRDYFYLDSSEMFGDSFAGFLYSTENQYSLLSTPETEGSRFTMEEEVAVVPILASAEFRRIH